MSLLEERLSENTEVDATRDEKGQETAVAESPESEEQSTEELSAESSGEETSSSEKQEQTEQEEQASAEQEEAAKPWYEELGYKSEEEGIKGQRELRATDTRLMQENAEIKKELEQTKALMSQISQFFQEPEREEAQDPAIQELNQQLTNTPAFQGMVKFMKQLEDTNRRNDLRNELAAFKSAHPDFEKVEPEMAKELETMSDEERVWLINHPGGYSAAIKHLYDRIRVASFSKEVAEKQKIAEAAKKKVEEENQAAKNLGGDSLNADSFGGEIINPEQEKFDGSLSYFTG